MELMSGPQGLPELQLLLQSHAGHSKLHDGIEPGANPLADVPPSLHIRNGQLAPVGLNDGIVGVGAMGVNDGGAGIQGA